MNEEQDNKLVGRYEIKPKYLGDGVYASFDGFQIWISVNDHNNKVVALEPNVLDELIKYNNSIKDDASKDKCITYEPEEKVYSSDEVGEILKEFCHHINRKFDPIHPMVGELRNWVKDQNIETTI